MRTYECNGNGAHIAIRYGSQSCPLCASHDRIKEAEDLVKELRDFIDSESPGYRYVEKNAVLRADRFLRGC